MLSDVTLTDYNGDPIVVKTDLVDGTHVLYKKTLITDPLDSTRVVEMDTLQRALLFIPIEHHEIHEGNNYRITDVADLAINAVYDMQFITPNSTNLVHFDFGMSCENEAEWYIYEGAVIDTSGAVVTPINSNRNSSNISDCTVYGITNTSLSNANSDTTVSTATQIAHGIIGSGKDGGTFSHAEETVLKSGTTYCFRVIANAAGYSSFKATWYEHVSW